MNNCVEAEHLEDAVPLSDVPVGLLRKDSFDINGIVVANLGEKMKDYKGYQSLIEMKTNEDKTLDFRRLLAHKTVGELTGFGIKNEDGTWDVVEVEVDASFSETQTEHKDELPMVIRHPVFGENCDYQVKDLVKCNAKSSLQYRGEREQGANHEKNKRDAKNRKSRGVKPLAVTFNTTCFSLGTHSIEEIEEKKNNARLLAAVTKKLVKKDETEMPSRDQFGGMLEHIGSRVLRDNQGDILSSGGIPDGPANTQVILQEYNKAKAERDQCKYHSVSIVNHSLVLTSRSTAHSPAASIKMKEVKVSVKLANTLMNEKKQLVATVPVPVLSKNSLSSIVSRSSIESDSSLKKPDYSSVSMMPGLPKTSTAEASDCLMTLLSLEKMSERMKQTDSSRQQLMEMQGIQVNDDMSSERAVFRSYIHQEIAAADAAAQNNLSQWLQPPDDLHYYGSVSEGAPWWAEYIHYNNNGSYYKNNNYNYNLVSSGSVASIVDDEPISKRQKLSSSDGPTDSGGSSGSTTAAIGATKRQRVESSGPPDGWNCPDCTLLNDVSDVSCKVCWYTLPRKRKSRS